MAEQALPDDFREFLKFLNEAEVQYLLIGGYAARITPEIDGQPVCLISKEHLRQNKRASGRHKDLDDLEHLPDDEPPRRREY